MLEKLPKSVRIVEVGPRDGLQNESTILSTESKAAYIKKLVDSGLKDIEITSFVRPSRILQMKDSKELYKYLDHNQILDEINAITLVPNMKGLESALSCNVQMIAVFTSISNSFNKKNINMSIDESMESILPLIKKARENGIKVRGYLSTIFGCPYEGDVDLDIMIKLSTKLFDAGCFEISLGDTIGSANPKSTILVIEKLKKNFDLSKFSMHFHDTTGMALSNILTSLEYGITSFDSSSAGLGGCPYAGGATGNIATEDVLSLMKSLNIKTGIDLDKLVKASTYILKELQKSSSASKYYNYISKRK